MNSAWWRIVCTEDEINTTIERIKENASPSSSYFVLLVLSTLIAAYGLVSNSTATVIGAMIVAPLMGPILGLAMGTVRAESKTFYESLVAESVGVLAVVLTGVLVALIVSPHNIDYTLSEIIGRTRPTLYDLAIGLVAGLAGAYCTVHPRLQASVAGVAIAVALVPPLAVTGLCTAGALYSLVDWSYAFGSFMLFFANFLTIETAASVVFLMAGMGDIKAVLAGKTSLTVKLILFILTAVFLTQQLHSLVRERVGRNETRNALSTYLEDVPWAALDSLEVKLEGNKLKVVAVVGAREEIRPLEVRSMERLIQERVQGRLENVEVELLVRTVQSVYASATGLHEKPKAQPSMEQQRLQATEKMLREVLKSHPFELESFRQLPEGDTRPLVLTVISPFPVAPRVVDALQNDVNQYAQNQPLLRGKPFELTVRSLLIRSATSEQDVHFNAPDTTTPEEKAQLALQRKVQIRLAELVGKEPGLTLLEAHVNKAQVPQPLETPAATETPAPTSTPAITATPDPSPAESPEATESPTASEPVATRYLIQGVVQGPQLVTPRQVHRWEEELAASLSEAGDQLEFELELESRVGTMVHRSAIEAESALNAAQVRVTQFLNQQLKKVPGAYLSGAAEVALHPTDGGKQVMSVRATVVSPRPIAAKVVKSWKAAIQKAESPVQVQLDIENRIGSEMRF